MFIHNRREYTTTLQCLEIIMALLERCSSCDIGHDFPQADQSPVAAMMRGAKEHQTGSGVLDGGVFRIAMGVDQCLLDQ